MVLLFVKKYNPKIRLQTLQKRHRVAILNALAVFLQASILNIGLNVCCAGEWVKTAGNPG